ncbi:unnamed protein product [Ilex paraguariensis]|uniref:Patatin n=1 Tax=Ilex paraguariensis TaxID=185542 RepID=A0ABC8UE41_9AQUA
MATISTASMLDSNFDVDKLTYEIFSILENKFLFGCDDPKLSLTNENVIPVKGMKSGKQFNGKVRILSIDGGGSMDGILAAKSLTHLESYLRRKSGKPNAAIADYFDVVAGSGAGGILAALLFTRGKEGGPMFTADGALNFMVDNQRRISRTSPGGILRRVFRPANAEKVFCRTFGDLTLKDALKAVLIPCYDLNTGAAFSFSRADALEFDGYDFKMRDVCAATSASVRPVEMRSVDGRTKIVAVGGGVAMNNPTAAAITHVLNNKQEFPLCNGVENLLVVSLGNGEPHSGAGNLTVSPAAFVKIAGEGASDMVDQSVSMAFGQSRTNNYVRIQANGTVGRRLGNPEKVMKKSDKINMLAMAEEMLAQKSVESVLFQGKKLVESTNLDRLELFAGELIKEQERRKTNILPTVILKQASPSPRTSFATTLSTVSSC